MAALWFSGRLPLLSVCLFPARTLSSGAVSRTRVHQISCTTSVCDRYRIPDCWVGVNFSPEGFLSGVVPLVAGSCEKARSSWRPCDLVPAPRAAQVQRVPTSTARVQWAGGRAESFPPRCWAVGQSSLLPAAQRCSGGRVLGGFCSGEAGLEAEPGGGWWDWLWAAVAEGTADTGQGDLARILYVI